MKYLLTFFAILLCSFSFAQKKKSGKISPPILKQTVFEGPPEVKRIEIEDPNKCFVNTSKENKEGLDYYTDTLLEYGWVADNARIIITSYNYDPVKQVEAKKAGLVFNSSQKLQFINGNFKISNNILTFTPEKLDKFKIQNFKLIYKSKKLNSLEGENKMILKNGKCLEPMVSM